MDALQDLQAKFAQVLSPKEWRATKSEDGSKRETSSAATRVFSVFELVEDILLYVVTVDRMDDITMVRSRANEIRALYRLQRVNTTTRDVISHSNTLRTDIFLQYKLDCEDNDNEKEKSPESSLEQAGKVPELPRHINPLAACLHELLDLHSPCLLYLRGYMCTDERLELRIMNKDLIGQVSGCASWRKMLLTNKPVCCNLAIHATYWTMTTVGKRAQPISKEVRLQEGATLGELADIVKDLVNAVNKCEFRALRNKYRAPGA